MTSCDKTYEFEIEMNLMSFGFDLNLDQQSSIRILAIFEFGKCFSQYSD